MYKHAPWLIDQVLVDTKHLLLQIPSYSLLHCLRECNQAAHWTAVKARIDRCNVVWEAECIPPELSVLLQNELQKSFGRIMKS